jgi:hypothetical protein
VVEDTVIASQTGGSDQSHQLFRLRGKRTFEISVVIDVVKALDQEVVGFVDVGVETFARIEEFSRGPLFSETYFSVKRYVGSLRSFEDRSLAGVCSAVVGVMSRW